MSIDRDLLELEPQGGSRMPTSGSDRVLLLLAALVFLGAVGIVVSNILPAPVADADATPTPRPSAAATPRASRSESPPPLLVVVPGAPVAQPSSEEYYQGWIRATADLPIRSDPRDGATVLGTLESGGIAMIQVPPGPAPDASPGWFFITEPAPSGWVQVEDGAQVMADQYPFQAPIPGSEAWNISSGPSGFLVQGAEQQAGTGASLSWAATTKDGMAWSRVDPGRASSGWWFSGAAFGPAGWLQVWTDAPGSGGGGPIAWVAQSWDGQDWTTLGSLSQTGSFAVPNEIVGSDQGYLLTISDSSGSVRLWHSQDGLVWTRAADPGLPNQNGISVSAGPQGFLAWSFPPDSSGLSDQAFSLDGEHWQPIDEGPGRWPVVAWVAGGPVAMDVDTVSGTARLWVGALSGGTFSWRPAAAAPAVLGGEVPAMLIGQGTSALAITWDQATEEVHAWSSSDGDHWEGVNLPNSGFGMIPHVGAASEGGYLLEGVRISGARAEFMLWFLDEAGWHARSVPTFAQDPVRQPACPAPPADALDFLQIEPGLGVDCFGDAPLTFRAWLAPCDGCFGPPSGDYTPAWLADPSSPRVLLTPIGTQGAPWPDVVAAPDLVRNSAWDSNWVEVTGHFDDQAADECRYAPDTASVQWYQGRQVLINQCRRRFVVTAMKPADAPP